MSSSSITLGQHGPSMASVGYGAMSLTNFYGPCDEDQAHNVLTACVDLGIDHIDTSNVYGAGTSESRIGAFLAKQGSHAKDMFKIATKGGITTHPETGARCFNNALEHLEGELDKSLARLGVDCVELFYVHRREQERDIEDVTEGLASLIKKGKTKHIGFSEIAPDSLRRASKIHHIAAVQSEYSLSTRAPELGLVQACAELGTTLVAFSPVGRTFLTDTPMSYETGQSLAFTQKNPRFMQPQFAANIASTDKFRQYAADHGMAAATLAIAWLLHQGKHVLPIPGTRSVEHLAQAVAAMSVTLSADMLAEIEAILPVGWAAGDRYSTAQWIGPERFC